MWCWRREKISWTDHVRNEEVLLRVKEQRNILHEIHKRKANWIGHILPRNCLLQRVIEGKIQDVTGRQGRRRRKLLDDFKERRWYSHLKEEALDRTMWRARFGRDIGPVVRQNTKWMIVLLIFLLRPYEMQDFPFVGFSWTSISVPYLCHAWYTPQELFGRCEEESMSCYSESWTTIFWVSRS
jgi:hypothetical protein